MFDFFFFFRVSTNRYAKYILQSKWKISLLQSDDQPLNMNHEQDVLRLLQDTEEQHSRVMTNKIVCISASGGGARVLLPVGMFNEQF